jgi:hypothetical protein
MKTNTKVIGISLGFSSVATLALVLVSGCVVEPDGRVYLRPLVVAAPAPAPVVTVDAGVPDDYVWDGYEYVGFVGGVYFYLGPGNVWLRCEPWRLDRFHGWERDHPDWHAHAIRNDRYRNDSHGHNQPRHDKGNDDRH